VPEQETCLGEIDGPASVVDLQVERTEAGESLLSGIGIITPPLPETDPEPQPAPGPEATGATQGACSRRDRRGARPFSRSAPQDTRRAGVRLVSPTTPGGTMDGETRNVLAAETLAAIEELGVPSGAWLVDLARMREDLHHTDKVLRRMENAIIRSVKPFDDYPSEPSTDRPLRPSTPAAPSRARTSADARARGCGWRAAGRVRTRRSG
jgi:hypothetical protein